MAEVVTLGLLEGHTPTLGFYSYVELITKFQSLLEANIGAAPLLRIKFDLDGDGIHEIIEQDEILSINNIDQTIEYLTNKPRYGGCGFTLQNRNLRWSDFFEKSYTCITGSTPNRYHFRNVIIELGLDTFGKELQENWIPLFYGAITAKTETGEDRTVSIVLLDEWSQLVNLPMAVYKETKKFFNYTNASQEDARVDLYGFHYGKHCFLSAERYNQNNQIMIPLQYNAGQTKINSTNLPKYYDNVLLINTDENLSDIFKTIPANHIEFEKWETNASALYVWGWNKNWFSDGKAQWVKLTQYEYPGGSLHVQWVKYTQSSFKGIAIVPQTTYYLRDYGNNLITVLASDLFNDTAENFTWKAALSIVNMEYSVPQVLYKILTDSFGIASKFIDATGSWESQELDFDNIEYYSFDTAHTYLTKQGAKVCFNIAKETTFQDVVEKICMLCRGSFFISKGKEIESETGVPLRRIQFVIHQPRNAIPNLKYLHEGDLISPVLSRDVTDIRNQIQFASFEYSETKMIKDITIQEISDSNSISVYGTKKYSVLYGLQDTVHLYDCSIYAAFLAQHYLRLYAEPLLKLEFSTNLKGLYFSLKSLLGINDRVGLGISFNQEEQKIFGSFEVYGMKFNTKSFQNSFVCQWAGYLLAPDGDLANKRWGYWDNMYLDEDSFEIEYYFW